MNNHQLYCTLGDMSAFIGRYGQELEELSDAAEGAWLSIAPYPTYGDIDITVSGENAAQLMRKVRKLIGGGGWVKKAGYYFQLTKQYTEDVTVTIQTVREQVCTRKVVGIREVVRPAVEARPERKEVEEIIEWECPPALAEV